jgi:Uma2 family endonuclease
VNIETQIPPEIVYPDSDGEPVADNPLQFQWIVTIHGNLESIFTGEPMVLVEADHLWYAVEGDPNVRVAPDVYVVFGRPKGYRGSYRQWQEAGIPPTVAFEILSPSNRAGEMNEKFEFYQRYGVEEYYVYDPDRETLRGWLRGGNVLNPIADMERWVSPRLRVRFEMASGGLRMFRPDGRVFETYQEVMQSRDEERRQADEERQKAHYERQKAEQERRRADRERQNAEEQGRWAERERRRADEESRRADEERQRVERERRRADEERRRAEQERGEKEAAQRRTEQLLAKLRELGIEPPAGEP